MTEVVERELEVAGLRTHCREARDGGGPNILYVHGVPTASWDWLPHLERTGGVENAGHWTWLDRPDVIDRAASFLLPAI